MEMCIDNPRSGFVDLFATHPPIEARVEALVKFAGGHDPGPLALPDPDEAVPEENMAAVEGPWGGRPDAPGGDKPFLPAQPPVNLGDPASPLPPPGAPGPWGPRRNS
jgi:heat shock protein HtpX